MTIISGGVAPLLVLLRCCVHSMSHVIIHLHSEAPSYHCCPIRLRIHPDTSISSVVVQKMSVFNRLYLHSQRCLDC